MAMGEWLSVQSSRELYEHQIKIEAEEISANPEEEQEELALIYQSKGLPEDRAKEMASHMMADKRISSIHLPAKNWELTPKNWAARHTKPRSHPSSYSPSAHSSRCSPISSGVETSHHTSA